jgi:hypothetical protein
MMTKDAVTRFEAIVTAGISESERLISDCGGITIDRCPDHVDEIQATAERALAVRLSGQRCLKATDRFVSEVV